MPLPLDLLKNQVPTIEFREKRTNIYKVLLPYFHEDGDMFDVFVEESPLGNSYIRLSDYGLTLMKLSYDLDLTNKNRVRLLNSIIEQNRCNIDDGNIFLDLRIEQFNFGLYQFVQALTKVSSLDLYKRETEKSLFYEHLESFVIQEIGPTFNFEIKKSFTPTPETDLTVDYALMIRKPIYIFGVNQDAKASKVVITCLRFQQHRMMFRSLIIHESFSNLSEFNQSQITNTVDKQFSSLKDFQEQGIDYLKRETASN